MVGQEAIDRPRLEEVDTWFCIEQQVCSFMFLQYVGQSWVRAQQWMAHAKHIQQWVQEAWISTNYSSTPNRPNIWRPLDPLHLTPRDLLASHGIIVRRSANKFFGRLVPSSLMCSTNCQNKHLTCYSIIHQIQHVIWLALARGEYPQVCWHA